MEHCKNKLKKFGIGLIILCMLAVCSTVGFVQAEEGAGTPPATSDSSDTDDNETNPIPVEDPSATATPAPVSDEDEGSDDYVGGEDSVIDPKYLNVPSPYDPAPNVPAKPTPTPKADTYKVKLDGQYLTMDVPPKMIENRVLVPLRIIFEKLGAQVEWNAETRTIKGFKGNKQITLVVGNKEAIIDGQPVALDVPPTIIEGRTLVPVRFIAESLGAKVEWDGKIQTVLISSNQ